MDKPEYEELEITDLELLERFGELHLHDAMRILATHQWTPLDNELLYEAVFIVLIQYMRKQSKGEFQYLRTYH